MDPIALVYIAGLAAFLLVLCAAAGVIGLIFGPDEDLAATWYPGEDL